jgi:hypothetical protein
MTTENSSNRCVLDAAEGHQTPYQLVNAARSLPDAFLYAFLISLTLLQQQHGVSAASLAAALQLACCSYCSTRVSLAGAQAHMHVNPFRTQCFKPAAACPKLENRLHETHHSCQVETLLLSDPGNEELREMYDGLTEVIQLTVDLLKDAGAPEAAAAAAPSAAAGAALRDAPCVLGGLRRYAQRRLCSKCIVSSPVLHVPSLLLAAATACLWPSCKQCLLLTSL